MEALVGRMQKQTGAQSKKQDKVYTQGRIDLRDVAGKKSGTWQGLCILSKRSEFLPQRGDIVLYLWKEDVGVYDQSHIGLVTDYRDGKLETIEGNTSENHCVERRIREYDSQVIGFLRPDRSN